MSSLLDGVVVVGFVVVLVLVIESQGRIVNADGVNERRSISSEGNEDDYDINEYLSFELATQPEDGTTYDDTSIPSEVENQWTGNLGLTESSPECGNSCGDLNCLVEQDANLLGGIPVDGNYK